MYARPNRAGAYQMRNLPAGQYFIAAVDEALLGNWLNPQFLEQVSRSRRPHHAGGPREKDGRRRLESNSPIIRRSLFIVAATAVVALFADVSPAARAQVRDLGAQGRLEPAGTSSVSGLILTEDERPKPLRRAIVTITEASSVIQPRVVTSDESGRFVFRSLPAGRYSVSARRPPYVAGAYGARRVSGPAGIVSGTVVVVGSAQQVQDINVLLPRGAVIYRDNSGY